MKNLLAQLVTGQPLDAEQASACFETIMTGQADPAQTGAALTAIAMRGPTVDELVGGASVMRQHLLPVEVPDGLTIVDTCGTGGTHSKLFNISTSAAIVVAAVGQGQGVAVAKHGNRSVTSRTGSSQVLDELGVKMPVAPQTLTRCLEEAGICFCFAPAHHPAMKHAGPVRAALGFRTIFNLLGPLTNPAGAKRQIIGTPSVEIASLMANALQQLGAEHAMTLTTTLPDGAPLGELTIFAPAEVQHLQNNQVEAKKIDPQAIGLPLGLPKSVEVEGPSESAAIIQGVLDGEHGPARDLVMLNAAAALVVADLASSIEEGLPMAAQAIDAGGAKAALAKLVEITQADNT